MCFNADTGKLLWEHRYNMFTSDVPAHRLAWSSPVVDPATGNVFAISGNGLVDVAVKDGKLLWERSLAEEMGMWTTHGGRMSTPIIDGEQLIVSGLDVRLGPDSRRRRTASSPSTSPPATPLGQRAGRAADRHDLREPLRRRRNGTRLFFSGGSDGAMHAIKIATGEPVWHWNVSKRGLNTVGADGRHRHHRHAQRREHGRSNEMGMLAAVPADVEGHADRQGREVDHARRSGRLRIAGHRRRAHLPRRQRRRAARLRRQDGQQLWRKNLGTIQKSSPVLADGKLYVGTENGKFYILKPHADGVDVLDERCSSASTAIREPIIAVACRRARPNLRRRRWTGCSRLARRARRGRAAAAAGDRAPAPAHSGGRARRHRCS